jgi:hypothetical protein
MREMKSVDTLQTVLRAASGETCQLHELHSILAKQRLDDVAADICQAEISALMPKSQLFMIQS